MPASIVVEQGVSLDVIIECFSDDEQTTRVDWTGWKAVLQARPKRGDVTGVPLLAAATDDGTGRLVLEAAADGPAGQWLRLRLDASQTTAMTQKGVWELVQVDLADPLHVLPVVEQGQLKIIERLVVL